MSEGRRRLTLRWSRQARLIDRDAGAVGCSVWSGDLLVIPATDYFDTLSAFFTTSAGTALT